MCWPAAAGRNLKHRSSRCLLTIDQSSVFEIKLFSIEELSKSENSYSVNTCGLWEAFVLSALSAFKKVCCLYDVCQLDKFNLVSDWFYYVGVVCSECSCYSNVSGSLSPPGVFGKA